MKKKTTIMIIALFLCVGIGFIVSVNVIEKKQQKRIETKADSVMTEQELEELYGKGWSLSELWEEGNFGTLCGLKVGLEYDEEKSGDYYFNDNLEMAEGLFDILDEFNLLQWKL